MPEAVEALARDAMPEVFEGVPVDLADSTLTRSLGLVRLLTAAGDIDDDDRRATLWTVGGLLDMLGVALDRVRLFEADA